MGIRNIGEKKKRRENNTINSKHYVESPAGHSTHPTRTKWTHTANLPYYPLLSFCTEVRGFGGWGCKGCIPHTWGGILGIDTRILKIWSQEADI